MLQHAAHSVRVLCDKLSFRLFTCQQPRPEAWAGLTTTTLLIPLQMALTAENTRALNAVSEMTSAQRGLEAGLTKTRKTMFVDPVLQRRQVCEGEGWREGEQFQSTRCLQPMNLCVLFMPAALGAGGVHASYHVRWV